MEEKIAQDLQHWSNLAMFTSAQVDNYNVNLLTLCFSFVSECLEYIILFLSIRSLVDCEWAEWEHGECSKTCGGGERTKIRNMEVEANFGGLECSGLSTEIESCNKDECPGIICIFHVV